MRLLPARFVCASALLFLAAGCAPAPPADTSAEDTAAINAVRDAWVTAYNNADLDALMDLFTEDVVSMPAGEPTATGRAATRQIYADRFAAGKVTASVRSDGMQLMGDWAFDRGTFTGMMTPASGGETMTAEGRYLVILRKQADGSWKIARDMDNSATPPPTSESGGQSPGLKP